RRSRRGHRRGPAAQRRRGDVDPLQPRGRWPRHHDVAHRAGALPPRRAPGASPAAHRPPRAHADRNRGVPAVLSREPNAMAAGDHLILSWLSANRDETVFERADEVILDRAPNPHLAFGVGAHRCIGMHLARTMFQVMVLEVLARIPDYRVDREATQLYSGSST